MQSKRGRLGEWSEMQKAGFWLRAVAGVLDLLVTLIPFAVFASLYSVYTGQWYAFQTLSMNTPPADVREKLGADFLFVCLCAFALCGWLYFAIAESSKWRATWGKHLLGLYVTDESGARVNFWKASARFASGRLLVHVPAVGFYYFLVDCFWVAFAKDKRAIHDRVSGCMVVRETGMEMDRDGARN
jgi:uncharacterized RDD family membrane protein YckC